MRADAGDDALPTEQVQLAVEIFRMLANATRVQMVRSAPKLTAAVVHAYPARTADPARTDDHHRPASPAKFSHVATIRAASYPAGLRHEHGRGHRHE